MRSALLCALALVIAGMLTSCSDECDVWDGEAIVLGTVVDSSGSAIVADTIVAEILVAGCDDNGGSIQSDTATTDSKGNYLLHLRLGNVNGVQCVRVIETRSGIEASGDVEFVGGCDDHRLPRTARLDLTVPVTP
jgi:hypothetical protein